jgi:phosphodiesterase/alkaline phosphatase D-like protein
MERVRLFRFCATMLCALFASAALYANKPDWSWTGAVTGHSVVISTNWADGQPLAIQVSTEADLSDARAFEPQTSDAPPIGTVAKYTITDLQPGTAYHYGWEGKAYGQFQTFPEGQASFRFAFASCAATGSNHPVFDAIREQTPLFFINTGDLHYRDIRENEPELYRQAYQRVLMAERQNRLFRSIPLFYMWDDHDYGPNNSDARSPSRPAALASYRQVVPHFPLFADGDEAPVGQAFSVGRVRFIMPDLRSAKMHNDMDDGPDKTMMGEQQLAWFKQELLEARDSHALIVFISGVPWTDHLPRADSWSGYAHERRVISDFMVANGITNIFAIAGDAHMIAADDGSNNTFASDGEGPSFPVYHAAAMDARPSTKGGPYSEGEFPGTGQFGVIDVQDHGQRIEITYTGRTYEGAVLIKHTAEWTVPKR